MLKDPVKKFLGTLIEEDHKYVIPNFQRAYAWETRQLDQFWQDLLYCAEQDVLGNQVDHYMGEIFLHKIEVDFNGNEVFQIIDGQQRITTYLILISCLSRAVRILLPGLDATGTSIANSIIDNTKDKLFLTGQDYIRLNTKLRDQLLFSTRIRETFLNSTVTEIDGAYSIKEAFNYFNGLLDEIRLQPNAIALFRAIEKVLNERCYIIRLEVEQLADIYSLFYTVNNRGLLLTVGELLRAKTIESFRGDEAKQRIVENHWNNILADNTAEADKLLAYVYTSLHGETVEKKELFECYMANCFPESKLRSLTDGEKDSLINKIEQIKNEIAVARKINNVEWPYSGTTLPQWKKDRLKTLLKLLDHKASIPLLIAAKNLSEDKFYKLLSKVELFFFNARIICDIHPGSFIDEYCREIIQIRNNPSGYRIKSLTDKLDAIRTRKNCDATFNTKIQNIQYNNIKNSTMKYFLYMINLFYTSFGAGRSFTQPTAAIIYDIDKLNIEHIYPRSAGIHQDALLEPLKNTLGNLVIMCEEINANRLKNKPFATKKPYYENCGFKSVEPLFDIAVWNSAEINNRKIKYLELASKIFLEENNI